MKLTKKKVFEKLYWLEKKIKFAFGVSIFKKRWSKGWINNNKLISNDEVIKIEQTIKKIWIFSLKFKILNTFNIYLLYNNYII